MNILCTRCAPLLFLTLAIANTSASETTNETTTANATTTTTSSSSGLQTWEIGLVAGVGGLALVLCTFACCLIYRRGSNDEKEEPPADVEAVVQSPPSAKTNAVKSVDITGLPAATKGSGASQVAVSTATKIKEKVSGNQGCAGPSGSKFPARWGEPPEAILRADGTCVTLPGGYGEGPRKLKVWIENQMMTDMKAKCNMYPKQQKCFPDTWSAQARKAKFPKPTVPKTYTTARAPGGYGEVPEVLIPWITFHINEDDVDRKGVRSASVELIRPTADRVEKKAATKRVGTLANR